MGASGLLRVRLHAGVALQPHGWPSSFGHYGAGGSLGFARAAEGWAIGYVINKMLASLSGHARTMGLVAAVQACL